MLFTFRASLCYLPAQRRDLKRLPVDCLYVAVWWCTCSIRMENHICFETMGGQRCCLTESCCLAFHIHIVQVYWFRGFLPWNLPKISDVVHILLENGCNTYATWNFPFALRPLRSHVACLKRPVIRCACGLFFCSYSKPGFVIWRHLSRSEVCCFAEPTASF